MARRHALALVAYAAAVAAQEPGTSESEGYSLGALLLASCFGMIAGAGLLWCWLVVSGVLKCPCCRRVPSMPGEGPRRAVDPALNRGLCDMPSVDEELDAPMRPADDSPGTQSSAIAPALGLSRTAASDAGTRSPRRPPHALSAGTLAGARGARPQLPQRPSAQDLIRQMTDSPPERRRSAKGLRRKQLLNIEITHGDVPEAGCNGVETSPMTSSIDGDNPLRSTPMLRPKHGLSATPRSRRHRGSVEPGAASANVDADLFLSPSHQVPANWESRSPTTSGRGRAALRAALPSLVKPAGNDKAADGDVESPLKSPMENAAGISIGIGAMAHELQPLEQVPLMHTVEICDSFVTSSSCADHTGNSGPQRLHVQTDTSRTPPRTPPSHPQSPGRANRALMKQRLSSLVHTKEPAVTPRNRVPTPPPLRPSPRSNVSRGALQRHLLHMADVNGTAS